MMLVPVPRVPKFVPPPTCVDLLLNLSALRRFHWMPNSVALSAVTSTMSAST